MMKNPVKFLLLLIFLIPFVSCSNESDFASDVIFITSEGDLWAMAGDTANYDKHYVLKRDLDLGGADWSPIGYDTYKFTGIFDGAGFKISGVYIDEAAENYQGLFGYLDAGAVVQNLGVSVDITAGEYVGGIAGWNEGTISGCYSEGNITATGNNAGGIAGRNEDSGMISNSYSTGNITGGESAGGIAGENWGDISNSYSAGNINTNSNLAGGIAGRNAINATISSSYSTGDIAANNYNAGGIAGWNDGEISNSYSTGDITASFDVAGGIAGTNGGDISFTYSTGNVSAGDFAGGIAGWNGGSVSNSVALGDKVIAAGNSGRVVGTGAGTLSDNHGFVTMLVGSGAGGIVNGGTAGDENGAAVALATARDAAFWGTVSFDTDIWDLDFDSRDYKLPLLKGLKGQPADVPLQLEPVLIWTEADLRAINDNTTNYRRHYILMDNITLNQGAWTPIGNDTDSFTGSFDGNGKKVSGIVINTSANYQGFFGWLAQSAVVKNLGVAVNIIGNEYVGGIAGENGGEISGSYSEGDITASWSAGGIAGENGGEISGSYSEGDITASWYAGGIAGVNTGEILDSHSEGKIEAVNRAGGIAGWNRGEISNSYSTGDITATNSHAGGIAGLNYYGAMISNSYSTGNITATTGYYAGGIAGANNADATISNSYSTGNITATTGYYAGGIAGENRGEISNSYSTGNITATTGYYAGGIAGHNLDNATISASYSTGDITATNSLAGGIAGRNDGSISVSYSTGDITATNNAGGIAGTNGPIGTISNCAALNNIITGGAAGRITGFDFSGNGLTNNHAFDGMEVNNSSTVAPSGTTANRNGADVSKVTATTSDFWRDTMGFLTADWNLGFTDPGRLYKLPWLLNMPLKPDGTSDQPTTLPLHLR